VLEACKRARVRQAVVAFGAGHTNTIPAPVFAGETADAPHMAAPPQDTNYAITVDIPVNTPCYVMVRADDTSDQHCFTKAAKAVAHCQEGTMANKFYAAIRQGTTHNGFYIRKMQRDEQGSIADVALGAAAPPRLSLRGALPPLHKPPPLPPAVAKKAKPSRNAVHPVAPNQ